MTVREFSRCSGIFVLVYFLLSATAWAQVDVTEKTKVQTEGKEAPETEEKPEVGSGAASKYFKVRQKSRAPVASGEDKASRPRRPASEGGADRYLALHLGTFLSEDVYKWGRGDMKDVGKFNAGVTYRIGEWVNSMDFLFRADFTTYELDEGRATKMSLLPMITFPDANSRFPLYFGGGAGLGIFFKQINKESALSFDYQLVAGARFFDLIDSLGFLLEAGMKNHIHLLSDGQYNGVFINVGAVFSF